MKNKVQKQAEEGAAKKATQEVPAEPKAEAKPTVEPKAVPAATQPATPNKQAATIEKLTAAFKEQRQIEVTPEMLQQDGKYINLIIGKDWPTIRAGNSGGVTVMELRSYCSAFEAALHGDTLLAKQRERETKKATAPTPVAAVKSEPAAAPVPVKTKAAA